MAGKFFENIFTEFILRESRFLSLSSLLRQRCKDFPPRTDYPLKLARPFGEYTAHLFNVINTRARVSLAVKYYFQLYFTLLCLFDERALFPGRLPTSCAVSVYYSRCLERKNLSQRLKEWSRWQCCFLLIGSRGLWVFFSKMATCVQSALLLKVSLNISTSSLVKSSPCCKSWISPDRLAVLNWSCWSLTHKTTWRF